MANRLVFNGLFFGRDPLSAIGTDALNDKKRRLYLKSVNCLQFGEVDMLQAYGTSTMFAMPMRMLILVFVVGATRGTKGEL